MTRTPRRVTSKQNLSLAKALSRFDLCLHVSPPLQPYLPLCWFYFLTCMDHTVLDVSVSKVSPVMTRRGAKRNKPVSLMKSGCRSEAPVEYPAPAFCPSVWFSWKLASGNEGESERICRRQARSLALATRSQVQRPPWRGGDRGFGRFDEHHAIFVRQWGFLRTSWFLKIIHKSALALDI